MKKHEKTLLGSIAALFIGTSCCWITSLLIWLGGATLIGTYASYIEDLQMAMISLGIILLIISIVFYLKLRKKKQKRINN